MIKACIFDLDGTTANTINSISYFANKALSDFNLPPIDTETYKYLVGNGARVLVEGMLSHLGADKAVFEELLSLYNTTYDNNFLYLAEPYEGVIDLLKGLKSQGIKTAILSNKPHSTTVKISDSLFGDELIDICYGGRDTVALKPDPQGVFEIIEQLGLKKEECLYIGDTSTDMKTGKNAGIYTVGVLWGFRKKDELEENGADATIDHPLHLLDIVNNFKED